MNALKAQDLWETVNNQAYLYHFTKHCHTSDLWNIKHPLPSPTFALCELNQKFPPGVWV